MRTLYLTDLDGTLLSGGALSPFTRQALELLYARGVWVAAATGRSWYTLDMLRGLLWHVPHVVLGGGALYDLNREQIVRERYLTRQAAASCLALGRRAGLQPFLYTHNALGEQRIYGARNPFASPDNRLRLEQPEAHLDERCSYVIFYGDRARLEPLLPWAGALGVAVHLFVERDGRYSMEMCASDATKEAGAKALLEITGADRLVAYGDNYNDLALFAAATESYAVADAPPEVRARATGVLDGKEDAVARHILAREGCL